MKLGSFHGEMNPFGIKIWIDSCFLLYQFQEGNLVTWMMYILSQKVW